MNPSGSQTISSQPNILSPIRAGFSIAANHLLLLLFPILVDLWVWLGVHLTLKTQMMNRIEQIQSLLAQPETQLDNMKEILVEVLVDRLNIMTALRSFPVGIPSLMSSLSPIKVPLGEPVSIDLGSIGFGLGWFLVLSIIGLALGTLYYLIVAEAALRSEPDYLRAIKDWPWAFKQVFGLTLVWLGIIIAISIPFGCIIPIFSIGNLSQFILFIYLAIITWIFYPLLLSAHGIFVNHDPMFVSIKKSLQLSRLTLPSTTLFLLFVLLVSQGLSVVWGWPSEDSWMMIIGLFGHAFVTTGLLAASFLYYNEADQWAQKFLRQVLLRQYS